MSESQPSPKGECNDTNSILALIPQSEESAPEISAPNDSAKNLDMADMTEEALVEEIKSLIAKYSKPVEDDSNDEEAETESEGNK